MSEVDAMIPHSIASSLDQSPSKGAIRTYLLRSRAHSPYSILLLALSLLALLASFARSQTLDEVIFQDRST